ncbi:lipocalin-like domain-containing protein [Bacteroidales bacterium OttesenSCG-928-J19]|nr:lipocalin-like domain-containing protein [Bacteroidales bacterium OttesenSCG-928-J19]
MKEMKGMKEMKIMKSRLLVYSSTRLLVYLFTCLLVYCSLFAVSCDSSPVADINGMWQLQTIRNEEGNTQHTDSIFYSFQRDYIFSYTELYTNELGKEDCRQLYGYADYPDDKTVHIIMDKNYHYPEAWNHLPWKGTEVEYRIIELKSKKLVLGYGNETYTFTKF